MRDFHYEITPLIFGRVRIIWTDGYVAEHFW
jgi:hypothetical protein